MKPQMLTLAGFRSFRAQQTIDFSQLGLFAIVGDTGAGKSSILEAIVYALYNKTTWSERDVKQLIALDTDTMRVDFEFTVREGTFRITRAAWRGPRPPIHALRSIVDSGYRFDGEAAVGEEVRRLTGMDYGTFIKTVVMPQGRFADLPRRTMANGRASSANCSVWGRSTRSALHSRCRFERQAIAARASVPRCELTATIRQVDSRRYERNSSPQQRPPEISTRPPSVRENLSKRCVRRTIGRVPSTQRRTPSAPWADTSHASKR